MFLLKELWLSSLSEVHHKSLIHSVFQFKYGPAEACIRKPWNDFPWKSQPFPHPLKHNQSWWLVSYIQALFEELKQPKLSARECLTLKWMWSGSSQSGTPLTAEPFQGSHLFRLMKGFLPLVMLLSRYVSCHKCRVLGMPGILFHFVLHSFSLFLFPFQVWVHKQVRHRVWHHASEGCRAPCRSCTL